MDTQEVRIYKVDDIARILGISRSSAYALMKKAPFHVLKVNRSIRVSKKSFDAWLDSQDSNS